VALVVGFGLALAAPLGLALSLMLVAMLQHVFDPPPDTLVLPWAFLAQLAGAAVLALILGVVAAQQSLRRLPLGRVLREQ
jgi:putative ABC transport system permease protein